ncbi:hypothetical protein E2320_021850 [Naja naja]|nr:hypothetical protein E2320_021850 [Naja naja]
MGNPPKRKKMSLKSVSLHNIPGGTPLKDCVRFQMNCTLDSAKILPSMVLTCQKVCSDQEANVFQSTVISGKMHTKDFFDISEIKASSEGILGMISSCQKTNYMTRTVVQKHKVCKPLSVESPSKIFSRMKQRVALVKEKNKPPEAMLLDPKCTTDYILTSESQPAFLQRPEKIPIVEDKQKTTLDENFLEESNVKAVKDFTAMNKNICTTVMSPPFLESPNKFFSRVKQKLQEDWLQKEKHPFITSRPTKKINNFNEEYLSTPVSQKEKIIAETAELASETFTIISNPMIMSDDHVTSKEFLKERASGNLPQEKAVVTPSKNIYGHKAGENLSVSPQKPSQHLCDTIFATPKVHIPRRRQPATKVPLDEPDTGTNEKTARLPKRGKDMDDVFWHSNVIVERIAHNQVKTLTGNTYMLEGCIDAVNMKKEGIPPTFIKRFGTGIPRNWKMLVDDLLSYMKRKEERAFPVSGDSKKIKKCSEELDLPQNIERKYKTNNTTYDVLPLQNDKIHGMQMETSDLQNDSEKSFTRSGRCVKPPMQYWCGERIRLDQALNITINKGGANYLSPTTSIMPPVKRQTIKFPKQDGKGLLKDHKDVPLKQAKGKINMKSKNITKKTKCKLKQQSQHVISYTEESNSELIIKDIYKKRATVVLTPLRKKMQEKQHSIRRTRNEQNVTKEYGNITCYEKNLSDGELDTLKCPLNLLKQHQQMDFVVESIPCTDEDESSEDIPCIKRKTRPSFRREKFNKECNNTEGPSCEQKSTENCVASSQSQKTKPSYFGQEETLEKLSNKSSSPDLDTSCDLEKKNRQKSQKCFKKARKNALASETESDNSLEEFPVEESKIKIPTKRINGHISTTPKAFPMTRKPYNQSKLGSAVGSLPDTNENWTEEELEKLAVASFPTCKSGFWLDVARTVRTRSVEECQQKYLAEQEGKKRSPKKTSKHGKKEGRGTSPDLFPVFFHAKPDACQDSCSGSMEGGTQQPLAKVGTLKRKQQMRNFLEQMPKDNHDDIFISTPFQNRNTKFCLAPEEDVFQLKDRHPITPASAIFPWVKTPQCDHISPGMLEPLDRESCEKQVFHMQNNTKSTWLNVKKLGTTVFTTPISRRTNVFNFDDCKMKEILCNMDKALLLKTHNHINQPRLEVSEEEEEEEGAVAEMAFNMTALQYKVKNKMVEITSGPEEISRLSTRMQRGAWFFEFIRVQEDEEEEEERPGGFSKDFSGCKDHNTVKIDADIFVTGAAFGVILFIVLNTETVLYKRKFFLLTAVPYNLLETLCCKESSARPSSTLFSLEANHSSRDGGDCDRSLATFIWTSTPQEKFSSAFVSENLNKSTSGTAAAFFQMILFQESRCHIFCWSERLMHEHLPNENKLLFDIVYPIFHIPQLKNDNNAPLPFASSSAHSLHKTNWTFLSIKTNDEVYFSNIQAFFSYTCGDQCVVAALTEMLHYLKENLNKL